MLEKRIELIELLRSSGIRVRMGHNRLRFLIYSLYWWRMVDSDIWLFVYFEVMCGFV